MNGAYDSPSKGNAQPGTVGLILAAGASSRLGQPKQLVEIAGIPLLVRAVRLAGEAGCARVLVVLGAQAKLIRTAVEAHPGWPSKGVQMVCNDAWQEGMASSIRRGIEVLREEGDVTGCLIMTCDQPLIRAGHLSALTRRNPGEACATAYAGRKGVPAYLPARDFGRLLELRGDAGARSLLVDAAAIDCPDAALDVDVAEDLERLRLLVISQLRSVQQF